MDRNYSNWMWSEACAVLLRTEQLHREMFLPVHCSADLPDWEPPVDILETSSAILVLVALPGVSLEGVQAVIEDSVLLIEGMRTMPAAWQTAVIHRMELPQGRFSRRVPLPPGRIGEIGCAIADGCLMITLEKAKEASLG